MANNEQTLEGDFSAKEPPKAIVHIKNHWLRHQIEDDLKERGFHCFLGTAYEHARFIFTEQCFDIRLIVADMDNAEGESSGSVLLRDIESLIEKRGYYFRQWFIGLTSGFTSSSTSIRVPCLQREFLNKRNPWLMVLAEKIAHEIHVSAEQFKITHFTDAVKSTICVPGELVASIQFGQERPFALSETPRFYADAIMRYSSEQQPLPARVILRLMMENPFYYLSLGPDTLNERNLIENWNRIKVGLFPIIGERIDEVVVSEKLRGRERERAYYLSGEALVIHKKITPSN